MKELVAKVKLPADAEAYRCLADSARMAMSCIFVFMYMWVQVNLPADQMLNIDDSDSCKYYQK